MHALRATASVMRPLRATTVSDFTRNIDSQMKLLYGIQEAVVQEEKTELGSALLKFRLLASRLGSDYLEEWVKHESEGYPTDIEVPSYRVVDVSYRGMFCGPFGARVENAQIPPYLIK